MDRLNALLEDIAKCRLCAEQFQHEPRPVTRASSRAQILIAGQAPGSRVHQTGIPFNDPSGDRLREWMGIDKKIFYNEDIIALLPMAFCFPGSGENGDLPPPRLCAQTWRAQLLAALPEVKLTVLVGRYAIDWHLPDYKRLSIAATVKQWQELLPHTIATPHPSPRNNRWLKSNPWFEKRCVPSLKQRVEEIILNYR